MMTRTQPDPAKVAWARAMNASREHQSAAGKARAATFSHEHQVKAGNCSFDAFSARWRASQGLGLLAAAHTRYIRPEDIRILGRPIAPDVARFVYDRWVAGDLRHVMDLIDEMPENAPEPDGSLWLASSAVEMEAV